MMISYGRERCGIEKLNFNKSTTSVQGGGGKIQVPNNKIKVEEKSWNKKVEIGE